jgi:transcriptional regulator with XRE-family HTH domain
MKVICLENLNTRETGDEKVTFGARLRQKRVEKGWSQYYLASRTGCTNSNISYLETHPDQRPKIETVEALAGALDWPVNEARRLAGYAESDLNVSRSQIEEEFRLALYGYKRLSENGRQMVRKQLTSIIDFVAECEGSGDRPGPGFEDYSVEKAPDQEVPEITLGELDRRIKRRYKNR